MQSDFTHEKCGPVTLEVVTGAVMSASGERITTVNQAAPVVLPNQQVVPGAISSSTSHLGTLWLRHDNGDERAYKLKDLNLPVLPGQRVSVLRGGPKGSSELQCFGVRNHNSGDLLVSLEAVGADHLRQWGFRLSSTSAVLQTVGVCAVLGGGLAAKGAPDPVGNFVIGAILGSIGGLIVAIVYTMGWAHAAQLKPIIEAIEAQGRLMLASAGAK